MVIVPLEDRLSSRAPYPARGCVTDTVQGAKTYPVFSDFWSVGRGAPAHQGSERGWMAPASSMRSAVIVSTQRRTSPGLRLTGAAGAGQRRVHSSRPLLTTCWPSG